MHSDERRIRERAHRLWEEEGRPEGRAESHWFQAKEIVAIEEGHSETLKAVGIAGDPVEPIEALVNAGEFPTLTDQGEMEIPHRRSDAEGGAIENEPISEIETIHRTLEVPAKRRCTKVPASDQEGAMAGAAGIRPSR